MYVVRAIDDYSVATHFVFGCVEPAEMLARLLKGAGFAVAYTTMDKEPERSQEEKDRAQLVIKQLFATEE